MTILFVSDAVVGRFDSIAARWVLAADRMREIGEHDSIFVVKEASQEAIREFTERGYSVVTLPGGGATDLARWIALIKVFLRVRPEVVFAAVEPLASMGLLASLVLGVKHRYFEHHAPYVRSADASRSLLTLIKEYLWQRQIKPVAAKRIISVSKLMADELERVWGWPNVVTIRNGLLTPLRQSRPDLTREMLLAETKLPPQDCMLMVGVGFLTARKGFQYLIEALPRVLQSAPNARLIIIGQGPEQAALEQRADAILRCARSAARTNN